MSLASAWFLNASSTIFRNIELQNQAEAISSVNQGLLGFTKHADGVNYRG
jgi:hypothetical protein